MARLGISSITTTLLSQPTHPVLFSTTLFFIQVGSNDATHGDPIQHFLNSRHWRGILIEPVDYVFKRLVAKHGKSERIILEQLAIAEANEKKDFFYLEESNDELPVWYDQLGSFLLPTLIKHAECIPNLEKRIMTTEFECITFQTLCDKHSVEIIDLLHVDTEGFDYEILKLIDFQHYCPALIMYEHKHLSEVDKAAAQRLLKDNRYEIVEIHGDSVAISSASLENEPLLKKSWNLVVDKLG